MLIHHFQSNCKEYSECVNMHNHILLIYIWYYSTRDLAGASLKEFSECHRITTTPPHARASIQPATGWCQRV